MITQKIGIHVEPEGITITGRRAVRALGALLWVVALTAAGPSATAQSPPPKMETPKPTTPQPAPSEEVKPAAAPEGGTPKLTVAEAAHDFGETWAGEPLTYTFRLKNEGSGTLEILKVKPQCGCTKAAAHPQELEPGETGDFPFSLRTKHLKGKYAKTINVETNDPNNPAVTLKLTGSCKHYVDTDCRMINFHSLLEDEAAKQTVKLTNNTDTPLELKLKRPAKVSRVQYELVEKLPGKEFELIARLDPPHKPGNIRDVVTLTTNLKEQQSIELRVSATFPRRLEINPNPLRIFTSGRKVTRQLIFENVGKTPVKLLDVVTDDEQLQARFEEKTPGKKYLVSVDVPAGYKAPEGGMITLKTDDAKQPEIKVAVQQQEKVTQKPPEKPQRPATLLKGKPAPAFSLTTTQGKALSQADFTDHITVVNFFAPNCPHCRRQLPKVEQVRKEMAAKGVRFVNVSQTMRKPWTDEQVKEMVEKAGAQAELAINTDNSVGAAYKAKSFPTLFVVGKDAKVADVIIGNKPDLEVQLRNKLGQLLNPEKAPAEPAKIHVKPTAASGTEGGPKQVDISNIRRREPASMKKKEKKEKP
jgi:thiol-disulfide isomerase/thioredoxin